MTDEAKPEHTYVNWRKVTVWPKPKDYPIVLVVSEAGEEPSHWAPMIEFSTKTKTNSPCPTPNKNGLSF